MSASVRMAIAAVLFAAPLAGQTPPVRQTAPPRTRLPAAMPARPPVPDTGKKGYALDFQDQDLRVVLSALAEAGNLNMTYSNLPARRVTLRMGTAATRAEIIGMIKGIAEANDLKVTENGTLMQIVGPPVVAAPTAFQQQQQNAAATELKLYTYRLKHASATTLAPLLTALFSNTTANTANVFTNPGTVQINTLPGAGTTGRGGQQQAVPGAAIGGRGAGGGAAANLGIGGGGNQNPLQGLQNLQQLFGGAAAASNVRVVGEPSSNALLIRATAADWVLMQQVLAAVDLRPLQVLIEVTIAEVARTRDLNVGLSGIATTNNGTADSASLPSAAGARDFILKLTGGSGVIDYNVAINALQSRGNTRVLSLPVIIAQNNVEAVLNVGQSRPFVQVNQSVTTGTVPTTVQTIQYIDVGTTLTITPLINPDGYVNLVVNQTDNSATNEVQFNAPVISKREASTQVFLRDGQTTVIGGLAGKSSSKTVEGIPILSKIPIIGGLLFGHTVETTTTSELYLFLTPHIISSDGDIDRLRDAVKNGTELLTQVPLDARIRPKADTIHVPNAVDTLLRRRQDSIRKADSLRARRPGGGPGGR